MQEQTKKAKTETNQSPSLQLSPAEAEAEEAVRRAAAASATSSSANAANASEQQMTNYSQKIPESIHKIIISFVLSQPSEPVNESGWEARHLAEKLLKKRLTDYHTFGLVSKQWKDVNASLFNSQACEVTSPRKLAELKSCVASLDLSWLWKPFTKKIKEKWGDLEYTEECDDEVLCSPLEAMIQTFGGGSFKIFARLVESEYRRFLVVKSVEHLNITTLDTSQRILAWQEKCQPTHLVDLMWHAHMLSPKKYCDDCMQMVGGVIDHEALYVSPNLHPGSDFNDKREFLFRSERLYREVIKQDYFSGRIDGDEEDILFSPKFSFSNVTSMLWEDMQGYNDCG